MFSWITNFYQHFIAHYSSIVALPTQLTRKDQTFSWRVEAINAFQYLKVFPLLIHVNLSKPFVLETYVLVLQ
jgi:hypothetical protein